MNLGRKRVCRMRSWCTPSNVPETMPRARSAGNGFAQQRRQCGDAPAKDPIYLADMHRHLWFDRLQSGEARPLGPVMAEGDATLVAWALGTDVLWITKGPRGFVQKSVPAPGEILRLTGGPYASPRDTANPWASLPFPAGRGGVASNCC
jgi:hypothetical protein